MNFLGTLMDKNLQEQTARVKVYVEDYNLQEQEFTLIIPLDLVTEFSYGQPLLFHTNNTGQIVKVQKRTVRSQTEIKNFPKTKKIHQEILQILDNIKSK